VLLIIQALQAAWGSLSRILQAVDAFVAFLKGVRWGNAGALFGKAVAAGAVAVIEFISQFLLQRLMGAAGAVAGKLRALAKRIGSHMAALGRGIARGATRVGRGIRAGAERGLTAATSAGSRIARGVGEARARARDAFTRLTRRPGHPKELPGHEFATARNFTRIAPDGSKLVRHGPMNPGELHSLDIELVNTFRSGSYTAHTLTRPKELYRVYSVDARKFRPFWTDIPPSGPLQSKVDSALLPSFGNEATKVVHVRVPPGETIFEGFSASQLEEPGVNLIGGGPQLVVNNVKPEWEVK
jgi:hypothetical protein